MNTLIDQAMQAFRNENYPVACGICRKALEDQPEDSKLFHVMGLALLKSGDPAAAISSLEKAISLNNSDAMLVYSCGIAFMAVGSYDKALRMFYRAVELEPDLFEGYFNLGIMLKKQGRLLEALKNNRMAVKLAPDQPEAWYNLGNNYYMLGRAEEACNCFQKVLSLDTTHFKAFINLSQVFKGKGEKKSAVLAASRAIELQPESSVALTNLAVILADSGQLEAAEGYARKAVEANGRSARGYLVLATILSKCGKMEAAETATLRAIQLDSNLSAAYMVLSTIYHINNRMEAAETAIRKAISIDSDFYEAQVALTNLLIGTERFEEAEKTARTAMAINPNRSAANLHLANVLFKRGLVLEAREAVDRVAIQTENTKFFEISGDILLCIGHYRSGAEKFLRAQQSDPGRFFLNKGLGICLKAGNYVGITELSDTTPWLEKIQNPSMAAAIDFWLASCFPGKAEASYNRFLQAMPSMAQETVKNPNPYVKRWSSVASESRQEKTVAMLTFARSATGFFHSIFDGHPQISTLPGYYFKGFFGKDLWDDISSDGYLGMAERFSALYPVLFDAACSTGVPGLTKSNLGIAEGFTKMGNSRNQTLTIDKARFEFVVKEMLAQRMTVNHGEFFRIIHRAFEVARGRRSRAELI